MTGGEILCVSFILVIIGVVFLTIMCLIISSIQDKFSKKKFDKILASDKYLEELIATKTSAYYAWNLKYESEQLIKKKIQTVIDHTYFHFLPYEEQLRRSKEAEELKKEWWTLHLQVSKLYDKWVEARENLYNYCTENNITKRWL